MRMTIVRHFVFCIVVGSPCSEDVHSREGQCWKGCGFLHLGDHRVIVQVHYYNISHLGREGGREGGGREKRSVRGREGTGEGRGRGEGWRENI